MLLEFGVLVNLLVAWCFVGCSLVTWLSSFTLLKFICQLLSLFGSHYNSYKVLLIVLCTLHFSGGEFESLGKHLVDCIIGMSLEWTYAMFQTHEWEWFIFPRSEVLLVHLALFHSMCLHDMLCGALGVIEFDIELVVTCFLENLPLLLLMKCLSHYLEWPLTTILACDMLWLAYFKEVVMFWVLDASPLVDFI